MLTSVSTVSAIAILSIIFYMRIRFATPYVCHREFEEFIACEIHYPRDSEAGAAVRLFSCRTIGESYRVSRVRPAQKLDYANIQFMLHINEIDRKVRNLPLIPSRLAPGHGSECRDSVTDTGIEHSSDTCFSALHLKLCVFFAHRLGPGPEPATVTSAITT